MKWTKLITLATCALPTLTSAYPPPAKGGTQVFTSETHDGNASEIAKCIGHLKQMLELTPKLSRKSGYRCGHSWWQFGGTNEFELTKHNLGAYLQCEEDLYKAATHRNDWFLCEVEDLWGWRVVAYSPFGEQVCLSDDNENHAPCRITKADDKRRLRNW
ncbi:hypothetical protein CERZMDRAFT_97147 [Cercospora zeae-maydis SCOH1-5]|uniref:Ecp2 effector protein domain-containing protein n=1 Tax=Cercospora zeae-maydis SCOH1-5 TaxID=717836 RepID=A0A6A6FGX4_9PEZI|nr:hypothetical protein CERZMDRAFT_97147 [Cercospora zeae-maydis SCOH1-5]